MAQRISHHCDRCGDRLDYADADGDMFVAGIYIGDGESLSVHVHQRRSTGHASWPIPAIPSGLFCSYECVQDQFSFTFNELRKYTKGQA